MQKANKFVATACMVPAYAIELMQPTASTDTPAATFASMLQGYPEGLENFAYLEGQDALDLERCHEEAQGLYDREMQDCYPLINPGLMADCLS